MSLGAYIVWHLSRAHSSHTQFILIRSFNPKDHLYTLSCIPTPLYTNICILLHLPPGIHLCIQTYTQLSDNINLLILSPWPLSGIAVIATSVPTTPPSTTFVSNVNSAAVSNVLKRKPQRVWTPTTTPTATRLHHTRAWLHSIQLAPCPSRQCQPSQHQTSTVSAHYIVPLRLCSSHP